MFDGLRRAPVQLSGEAAASRWTGRCEFDVAADLRLPRGISLFPVQAFWERYCQNGTSSSMTKPAGNTPPGDQIIRFLASVRLHVPSCNPQMMFSL